MAESNSVSSLLSVLIPTGVYFGIFMLFFILLRKKQTRVYEPRTTVDTVSNDLRPDESPRGIFGWLSNLLKKPERYLIQQVGVDGYFFLRLIFQFSMICFIGCFVTWPILFSVNASNSHRQQQLDRIAFGNVKDKWRYFAHVFVSWVFFGGVVFFIYRELVYYTTFRHVLQTTPLYDSLLSSRTLLLTEAPDSILDETDLRKNFPTATNIWYARDYTELQKTVKERTKLTNKYEGALNKVIKKAVKLRNKCLKKGKPTPEPADDLNKYLKDGKKRPTHRLKFLIGEKVDTLNYGADHLGELNKEIKKKQLEHLSNTQVPSVFLEFPTQLELQKAYQAIPYNKEFKNTIRLIGLTPDDIIWENMALTTNKKRVKKVIANTVLTLLIIFWNIPVAFVGAISNIYFLIQVAPWLKFLENMPSPIRGIINGLFPVIALSILMAMVPVFIKKMGKVAGCVSVQQVDSYCQTWYYAFQIVNCFIAMTLASAAISAAPTIVRDPLTAMGLLKQYVPTASNFFINYFIYQGLSITASMLAQLVPLILAQFLGKILDGTPRAKWNRWNTLGQPGWATTYPTYQILFLIAMAYSIISPLILGFATIAFAFFYFAFIYCLVYVLQPYQHDSRGKNYLMALFMTFGAVYFGEVWILALFVFSKNWACVVLEAVCIAATALAHIYFKWKFLPLVDAVPISAIKYASGDSTFQYPMHDQGLKEIKVEGENYWQGGNQLGLAPTHDQVLPSIQKESKESKESNGALSEDSAIGGESIEHEKVSAASANDISEHPNNGVEPKKFANFFKRYFHPKLESFDMIRKIMPNCYFNYIEYNDDFLKTAYDDPAVTNEEPHIWIARDEMGLSEIEKNKALENGVDVSDDNATFDEKGDLVYTGPPPSYEEAIKM
ncbi:uncharacterized protein PRCAT00005263001 [Priceomyces carsonii]|uniref:uncharacterized protein n=1 Tax=Priceomyces carsonii TaxID=28549 RepID=UPI002ED8AF58|nr:unnamed protein product [Priceomyces carsonii]